MFRTQVYLTNTQVKELKRAATSQRATVSEVIRKLLDERIGHRIGVRHKRESMFDVLRRIGKTGKSGPRDLATNLDNYLYGKK